MEINHGVTYRRGSSGMKTENEIVRLTIASLHQPMDLKVTKKQYKRENIFQNCITKSQSVTEFDTYSDMFDNMPLTEETTCGFWIIKGPVFQKMASKKVYVALYGLLCCFMGASYAYFNGTITTMEKRFQIPSHTTGIITVGGDISQLFTSIFLSYYAGKGHRPRWMAFGTLTMVIFCVMTVLPHAMYGPGNDALQLTEEYGKGPDLNATFVVLEKERKKTLCQLEGELCSFPIGSFYPQLILFGAQFIGGIGSGFFYSIGFSYMDDNILKSKTPLLISFTYFLRMLGSAFGYSLAAFCLKLYVSPNLTPSINSTDPRWLGAWWLGWLILGIIIAFFGLLIGLFPKTLPRAAVRRAITNERKNTGNSLEVEEAPSFLDFIWTLRRLVKNRTYVANTISSTFYCFGGMPYWNFMPKYIETQYKQSASASSFATGTVGLVFSAVGVLGSGIIITQFKPRARVLAGWNVMVGAISVAGMISYVYLGCDAQQRMETNFLPSGELNTSMECNAGCQCNYVPYSPVCSEQGVTFISPCHAGCWDSEDRNGTKTFTECSCIKPKNRDLSETEEDILGTAVQGNCPIDCTTPFYTFLTVVCVLKFIGAAGGSANFIVGIRCIEERDKTAAMGLSLTIISTLALVPAPIFFGYILDTTCLVWGKNCSGTGNCWLYDGYQLRYVMNLTAAFFVAIGTFFDGVVWYYVKNLKIFDDDAKVQDVSSSGQEE